MPLDGKPDRLLTAKAADPGRDCRSVQATCGLRGAFDARTIADEVVVPFDRANENVLGGSTEPYANNPLRIPAIVPTARSAQRDKSAFDDLCKVLDYAEKNPQHAVDLLRAALEQILHGWR